MVDEARDNHAQQIERAEIGNLVRSRMESLNLPSNDYDECSEKRNHLSYVIINPSCDLKLEEGDIMWVSRSDAATSDCIYRRRLFAAISWDHLRSRRKKPSSDTIRDESQTFRSARTSTWPATMPAHRTRVADPESDSTTWAVDKCKVVIPALVHRH